MATRKAKPPRITLHIVSDATGTLARHLISTVLTQFPGLNLQQVYHTFVEDDEDIQKVVKQLRRTRNLVLFGLVNSDHKTLLSEACDRMNIPSFDLTGSLVQFIADHTSTAPVNELSRLHETDAGYFKRIDAMEFTAQHDDSRRIESIHQADIVIVGLSRVSKSPTATYLGAMGYKVANVSISQQTGFPEELDRVKGKTVAFTVMPKQLQETRARRFDKFKEEIEAGGLEDLSYYDMRSVVREVVFAEREYRKRGYPILTITGKTVEELAVIVLRELNIKRQDIVYRDPG